jgi:transitional endoplasmic reticulum ATPase
LTANYVSSDIEFLVNEASRLALKEKSRITMQILEKTIQNIKPSVPFHELQKYEIVRAKMNSEITDIKKEQPRIGFKN